MGERSVNIAYQEISVCDKYAFNPRQESGEIIKPNKLELSG